jgi:hypothetical protein
MNVPAPTPPEPTLIDLELEDAEPVKKDTKTMLHRVQYAVTTLTREEIRGVTWDLGGWRLYPRQKAQYAYGGGFADVKLLQDAIATFDGESGGYLKAWHYNVRRNDDGTIFRDDEGRFIAKSVDLGWIQKNILLMNKALHDEEAADFVEEIFTQGHPELARPLFSATIAYEMYLVRGWEPWYAYTNGGYKRHLGKSCLAIGNWLAFEDGLGAGYLKEA